MLSLISLFSEIVYSRISSTPSHTTATTQKIKKKESNNVLFIGGPDTRRLTWQTKGTQIWLCKCRAAERLDSVPGENRRSARRANPAGNKSTERIDGDRKSRGRRRGERVEGCNNDHRETETDFPSSTWEILPVSLQPARTVTHDYSPFLSF